MKSTNDFDNTRLLADEPSADRRCGDCTACCTVLAVAELRKPMRCACHHIVRGGCRVYADRPHTCRQFNCLWLRGALPADERLRPDSLGVIFDAFRDPSGALHVVALEVWRGAFESNAAREILAGLGDRYELRLNNRDGDWAR